MNYTTLKKIKAHRPCQDGLEKLLASLDKTKSDDEPLSLLHIVESNGIEDAIWALRASDATDKDMRLYAVWCARQVQHLMNDKRSINVLDVSERYANGQAADEEFAAARAAAYAAADSAARAAAYAAADAAAFAAAYAAAYAAADAAAFAAARAAAYAAQKSRFIKAFCGGEK